MRWPLVAAAGSAAVSVAGLALVEVNGGSVLGDFNADLFIVGTIYAVVGGVILDRVPGNWLGRVLLVAGWLWALDLLLNQYAIYGIVTVPGSLAAAGFASWMAAWLWIPGNSLLLSGTPLLFPNGRLLSRRWLPVAAIIVVGVVASVIGHAVVVWPIRDTAQALDRSFDAADVPGLAGTLASIGDMIGFLFAPFAAIAALVVRYRRAHGIARQQMRWFTAAIALAACGAVLDQVATLFWPESQGALSAPALALVPVALAIAVLRYHLYDIDRIISRTLSWALISAVLVAVFATVVVTLQNILQPLTHEDTLAVAASTLIAATLFQPLRRRVQRAVDRRFNRAGYDAQRTTDAFGLRLRHETDPGAAHDALMATALAAVQPTTASVWLRSTEGGR